MHKRELFPSLLCILALCSVAACSNTPPPRPFYEDSLTSIKLQHDEHAKRPHTHPATVSPEIMSQILSGVRAVSRQGMFRSIVLGTPDQSPAFSASEIYGLAPKLSQALAQAKPEELVTFYRRVSDENVGLGITSGGLFVQDEHLYFVLANDRTLPTSGMNQNMVYALDPIDTPLLPISRTDFKTAFTPGTALVREEDRISWPYIDEGRILAIDLEQLARDTHSRAKQP